MLPTKAGARPARPNWRVSPPVELSPLLEGALDAFFDNGYHGTSVRDIASRVGITVPALYYHHENKEAILFALLDSSIKKLCLLCKSAVDDACGKPDTCFFNLVECMVRYMTRSGKISFLDAEIRSLSPENRKLYVDQRHEIEMMLLKAIEASVNEGLFDVSSPRDTARALLGMIQAISTWYRPGGELSVREVARRYVDIAAHTVGAKPGTYVKYDRSFTKRKTSRR